MSLLDELLGNVSKNVAKTAKKAEKEPNPNRLDSPPSPKDVCAMRITVSDSRISYRASERIPGNAQGNRRHYEVRTGTREELEELLTKYKGQFTKESKKERVSNAGEPYVVITMWNER